MSDKQRKKRGENKAQIAMPSGVKRRIENSCYLFVAVVAGFAIRVVQLQAFARSDKVNVATTFTDTQILPARRGQILATDGTALAVTLNQFNVAVNPRAISDKPKMARLIAQAIGGDGSKYLQEMSKVSRPDGKPNYYVSLERNVEENRIDKLRKVMGATDGESRKTRALRKEFWAPLTLEPSPRRQYPLGPFAPQLIGFTGRNGHGADGLEKAWDETLAGKDGEVKSQVDSRGRPVPGFVAQWQQPVPGRSIVTTIDPQIQADTDNVLQRLVTKYKPNFATAIVMKAKTGEIVAMSNAPLFDLNKKPADVVELATNRCLTYAYEPGSTFKIITASAAVENISDWRTRTYWVTGAEPVGKHVMHDWTFWSGRAKSENKTLSEGIRDSSNITMWHFAHAMGAPVLAKYAENFGIGKPVEMGPLPTARGMMPRNAPGNWGDAQLANFSFGQGMMLTPIQLVRAVGVVANDGVMVQPRIIKELRDEQGRAIQNFPIRESGRVIESETAKEVTKMMVRVVAEGTARKYVFVPGYSTAGKTGSAQKADGKRGYNNGKFISSLTGFVPANKPEYVILVMADEPHGSHWGSEVCGPAFNEIANKVMLHLRLEEGADAPAPDPNLMVQPKTPQKMS